MLWLWRSLNLLVTKQELTGYSLLLGLHCSTSAGLQLLCIHVRISFYIAGWASSTVKWSCQSSGHGYAYPCCPFKVSHSANIAPASWSLAQTELEDSQKAFADELTCSLSAQVGKLKPDVDAAVVIHNTAHVTGSQLNGQQDPVSGLCSSAGVLAA